MEAPKYAFFSITLPFPLSQIQTIPPSPIHLRPYSAITATYYCCYFYVTIVQIVFENMVLRRIFGPRRDKVMREWRKLHNKELNDMYSSPNIVRVIKSRRMRWAGHVAHMGEERGVYRVWVGETGGKETTG